MTDIPTEQQNNSNSTKEQATAENKKKPAGMIPSVQEESKEGKVQESTLTKEQEIEEALNCPCIEKMKEGSCGEQFISAYRCFLESESEPKGSDCIEYFSAMQKCMVEHPDEYDLDSESDDSDDLDFAEEGESNQ
eukprot:jgi/Galph1/1779/GphlegSOOS_G453.1